MYPPVLRAFQHLRSDPCAPSIRRHIGRSADGMARFMSRSEGSTNTRARHGRRFRGYCYVVGGIAGEMLTELLLLDRPKLARVADELKSRAAAFEGLRLVHILKATKLDQPEGRVHLPWRAQAGKYSRSPRIKCAIALRCFDTLRAAGAEPGLVAFDAFVTNLAIANLAILRDDGPGSRLLSLLKVGESPSKPPSGRLTPGTLSRRYR